MNILVLVLVVIAILFILLLAVGPWWSHSVGWGPYPASGICAGLVIILVLFLFGRL